jgi:CxxC motif-containing protein
MSDRKIICVRCPRGCEIGFQVDAEGRVVDVEGNFCKLGKAHVEMELTDPRRTLTTTVRVTGGTRPLVPVWTEEPLSRARILELAGLLRDVVLEAPVALGDVVLEDALGAGIRVLASASVPSAGS